MLVHLRAELDRKLEGLPESGMGYQVVDLILSDGRKLRNVVVFNAEEAQVAENLLGDAEISDVEQSSRLAGR